MKHSKGISFEDLQSVGVSELDLTWMQMRRKFSSLENFHSLNALKGLSIKKMFGGLALRLGQKLCLVLMESPHDYRYKDKTSEYPLWDGVLICTSREHHRELCARVPDLMEHPILKKWLYLRRDSRHFEKACKKLCVLLIEGTELVGVVKKKTKSRGVSKR